MVVQAEDTVKEGKREVRLVNKIVIVFLLCLPSLAYGAPSIEFVREVHDFGYVAQGEQLEYTFVFTNRGTDELVIKKLETS
jgi:hypothetical protein